MRSSKSGPPRADLTRRTSWSARRPSTAASARSIAFSCVLIESRPGYTSLEVSGGYERFCEETGGHRWQRVPPSEKRGRVHTSTVTVAVFPVSVDPVSELDPKEIEWTAVRGGGKGGQAKQKTSNAVMMKHLPSGIVVRVETDRSQWRNRRLAAAVLAGRVAALSDESSRRREDRRSQVGSGMRADKRRTIRSRDDRVVDHLTGKKTTLKRYEQGHLEDLR